MTVQQHTYDAKALNAVHPTLAAMPGDHAVEHHLVGLRLRLAAEVGGHGIERLGVIGVLLQPSSSRTR